jgi:AbrB family looped-hinge helix DNA binding protein
MPISRPLCGFKSNEAHFCSGSTTGAPGPIQPAKYRASATVSLEIGDALAQACAVLWLTSRSRRFTITQIVNMEFKVSEPTTMSIKGQVTIPRDVRERLGLQAGDKIAWSLLSNGTVVVRPKTRRLVDLVGVLTRPGQPGVTVDEMRLPE